MGRRKVGKENIRNIQKSQSTYYISIPKALMKKLRWRERQKVVVTKLGKGLRIKDWPVRKKKK